jgi:hypothetical protein
MCFLYLSEKNIIKAIEKKDVRYLRCRLDFEFLRVRRSKLLRDGTLLLAAQKCIRKHDDDEAVSGPHRVNVFDHLLQMLRPEHINNDVLLPILQILVVNGDEERFNRVWKLVDIETIDDRMKNILVEEARCTLSRVRRKDTFIASMTSGKVMS